MFLLNPDTKETSLVHQYLVSSFSFSFCCCCFFVVIVVVVVVCFYAFVTPCYNPYEMPLTKLNKIQI